MRAASPGWQPASLVSFERFQVLPRMAFLVAPARVGLPSCHRWPHCATSPVPSSQRKCLDKLRGKRIEVSPRMADLLRSEMANLTPNLSKQTTAGHALRSCSVISSGLSTGDSNCPPDRSNLCCRRRHPLTIGRYPHQVRVDSRLRVTVLCPLLVRPSGPKRPRTPQQWPEVCCSSQH